MANPFYGSIEYYERELLKARVELQAVETFATQELKTQTERYLNGESLAILADVIERANTRVKYAEEELQKQKDAEEEAREHQEMKKKPDEGEEDA